MYLRTIRRESIWGSLGGASDFLPDEPPASPPGGISGGALPAPLPAPEPDAGASPHHCADAGTDQATTARAVTALSRNFIRSLLGEPPFYTTDAGKAFKTPQRRNGE